VRYKRNLRLTPSTLQVRAAAAANQRNQAGSRTAATRPAGPPSALVGLLAGHALTAAVIGG
jgi:hypothetical protein